MKPYVIASPDYNTVSGGIKVMWGLYGHLLARGVEVYMNRKPEGEVIAIYPEIQAGNPVGTDNIVRYVLNKPGVMGGSVDGNFIPGPSMFDPSEKVYYFSQLFSDTPVPDNHLLFLPVINLHIFKVQKGINRNKKCKFVGKGIDSNSAYTQGLFSIDRAFARDQQALADYLNTCSVMYCYDPCTAMTEIARLCGCRVVMMNNQQFTKEEFSQYEPGMNGLSWGTEEEEILDAEAFRKQYINLQAMFSYALDNFIEETQK